jgi:hypothetical protein
MATNSDDDFPSAKEFMKQLQWRGAFVRIGRRPRKESVCGALRDAFRCQIVDFRNVVPGDVGMTRGWQRV